MPLNNPIGALTIQETQVFNGASPIVWTDLDLSATIGAGARLVLIKIDPGSTGKSVAVRKNGDTDEFYESNQYCFGCAKTGTGVSGIQNVFMVATDNNGIIEWRTETSATMTIDVIGFVE
jgi:hypothetical protein